jgi:hypothetical protein
LDIESGSSLSGKGGDVAITVGSGTNIGGDFGVMADLSSKAAGGGASIVARMSETSSGGNLALALGQFYTSRGGVTIDGGVSETALGGSI